MKPVTCTALVPDKQSVILESKTVDPHLLIPLPHVGLVPFLSQLGRPFPTFPQNWGLCIYVLDKPCLRKLGHGSAIRLLNNDYGTERVVSPEEILTVSHPACLQVHHGFGMIAAHLTVHNLEWE